MALYEDWRSVCSLPIIHCKNSPQFNVTKVASNPGTPHGLLRTVRSDLSKKPGVNPE